jgi:hypothetical protein
MGMPALPMVSSSHEWCLLLRDDVHLGKEGCLKKPMLFTAYICLFIFHETLVPHYLALRNLALCPVQTLIPAIKCISFCILVRVDLGASLCGPKGMPCIPFTRAAAHGFFLLKCEIIIISQSSVFYDKCLICADSAMNLFYCSTCFLDELLYYLRFPLTRVLLRCV